MKRLIEDNTYLTISVLENAIDSLETAAAQLVRLDNLKWKWVAITLHHALYTFCVAALTGSNYENVLGDDSNCNWCKIGSSEKWNRLYQMKRPKSSGYLIEWKETDEVPPVFNEKLAASDNNNSKRRATNRKKLIGFWTAFARIQDDVFWMKRFVHSRAVGISNTEWDNIEWLTNEVRNGCVHFIPKFLIIPIVDIQEACKDVVRIIEFLAFESNTILFNNHESQTKRIAKAIEQFSNYRDSADSV